MGNAEPMLLGLALLALVAAALGLIWRGRRAKPEQEDSYTRGLELWLAGDLPAATEALRDAIARDPDAVDPYLQLGNLLRKRGEAQRAMALHRGLAARPALTPQKRISVTLALVEDLLVLKRWQEAGELLDELQRHNLTSARYWSARFRQALGRGDESTAARILREAARRAAPNERQMFRDQHESFQLDRGVRAALRGDFSDARRYARNVADGSPRAAASMFVQALSRLGGEEHERAAEVATEGLLKAPELVHLFLPVLQRSLLATGQYSRVVPILESACRNPAAPPELWIALAQLHEKMGDREMAVQVFEEKAGDPRLTPAVASPLLRVLVNDLPDSDFTRIWNALAKPEAASAWACRSCGAVHDGMRWYCPECGAFDSVGPAAPRPAEPSRPQPRSPRLLIEAPEAAAP